MGKLGIFSQILPAVFDILEVTWQKRCKIRIVFLKSRAHFQGGLEKYTLQLIHAFAKKGCEVILLTTGPAPFIQGVHSLSVAPDSQFTLFHLCRFDALCKKWLEKNPCDIVFGMERTTFQTHYRAGSGVHAVYLKRRGDVDAFFKKISFVFNPLHRKLLAMEKKAFEDPRLKVLFTNSYMVKDEILNNYLTPHEKIEVVHNGVEWNKWKEEFENTFQNKKIGPFKLLFVGNGYKRKGLLFLLNALTNIKRDFHLTVIGKEKQASFFIDWAAKNQLQKKISFEGPQKNILPYYQASDAIIIPSIYDPFANVTVEALAMGLFVVSSAFNGGKEVLKDFSGTVIQDLFSPISVCTALEKAFMHPKTEASARKIRESIKELDFSNQLDKIVNKTLQSI